MGNEAYLIFSKWVSHSIQDTNLLLYMLFRVCVKISLVDL